MRYYPIKKNTDLAQLPTSLVDMLDTLGGATLNPTLNMYVFPEAPQLGIMLAKRRVRDWTQVEGVGRTGWVNTAVPGGTEVIRIAAYKLPLPDDEFPRRISRPVEFTVELPYASLAIPELLNTAGFDYVLLTRRRKLRALIA